MSKLTKFGKKMVSFSFAAGSSDLQARASKTKVLASKQSKLKKFGAKALFLEPAAGGVGGRLANDS